MSQQSLDTFETSESNRLPVAALLALAMTGFTGILTETIPAGLLPQISQGLGVSEAFAGQTVTIYAIGSVIAAIPLTVATQGWRRRSVLLVAIIGFLVFNTITALSPNYFLTMTARFFAGISAGLSWSLLAGYARRMVHPTLQGRAMALAMVGTPVALSLGVPVGTWLGNFVGWRITFGIMSILTLLLIVWVLLRVPDYPGQSKRQRLPLYQIFTTPGVRSILAVIVAWMLAHNILYTYIAPFLSLAGLTERVDLVLLIFGLAALIGIWIVGMIVERWLRLSVLLSLIVFAVMALAIGIGGASPIVVYPAVAVWGLTFGGAATLLQTALADAAGDGADVAQSMCVTVWNCAIAGGGIVGGFLLETKGVASFPWALLLSILVGLIIAAVARRHGFPAGHRVFRNGEKCL